MDFKSILKTVGGGLISQLVPGGGLIIEAINGFLPDDKKISNNSTGDQAQNAINSLPPDVQSKVLCKEHDVTIEEIKGFTSRFQAMADVDKSGNTTRPQIALMMARIVSFSVVVTITIFSIAVMNGSDEMVKAIVDGWPFIFAVLATPTALLRSYFAMRTKEKQHKYEATTGVKPIQGLISSWLSKK